MPRSSKTVRRLTVWLGAIALAAKAHAQAQAPTPAPDAALPAVEVVGNMSPREEHSYADLLDAVEQFAPWEAAHRGARLRFRVRARRDPALDQDLEVAITDPVDKTRTVLILAAGGRFELPVSETWRAHRAIVRTNRPDGSLAWAVEVTHEGDDEHLRRLGDLREECHLDIYAATLARGVKTPSFYAMKPLTNMCATRFVGWVAYADHPVFAVHIDEGTRHESLGGDHLHGGDVSVVPLGALLDWADLLRDENYAIHTVMADSGWSDEARLQLVFADDPPLLSPATSAPVASEAAPSHQAAASSNSETTQ